VRAALDDPKGMARIVRLRMSGAHRIPGLARRLDAGQDPNRTGSVPRGTRRPVPSFAVLAALASLAYLALVVRTGVGS
jgi:hypothetical protein